ncbi:hypothetical protein [Nannocystis radixulma]|uniref:Glycosyl-4,4'-diaponeurosporenoate acyltransferase n=1 Tax=Nannocystis radixulma TaxID=2995305 RepID=A0ABT5BC60_9BACT|nr:hypothetical protein [Nannocystis radixulma]MDC0670657.1 hypothetical protein [Nannocystis radixulma]
MAPRTDGLARRASGTEGSGPFAPQRWGIAPTHEFWVLAAPTPIGLIALIGFVGTLLALLLVLGHVLFWWQQILLVPVLFWLWQGLVERCARVYLRRLRAARPVEALDADPEQAPRPEYEKQVAGIMPTTDFWATKAERWFGRAAKPVSFTFELLWWASACSPFWQLWIVAYLVTPLTLGLIERSLRRHEQRRLAHRSTETASISA